MNKTLFDPLRKMDGRARNAFFVTAMYSGGALLLGILLAFQLVQNPSLQLWVVSVSIYFMVVAGLLSLRLIWKNHHEAGIWLTVIGTYIIAIVIVANISGLVWVIFASALILSAMVAIQTLQERQTIVMVVAGIVEGIIILLADQFIQTERLAIPGFQTVIYIILPVMLLLFGYFIARQFGDYSLRTKLIITFVAVTLVAVGVVGYSSYTNLQKQIRADISQRLANIAGIVATQQDGELHAAIQTPEDITKDAYQKMMAQWNKIIATVPDLAYIYTMRKNEQGQIYFVVDAEGEGNESVAVGTVYEEPSALLLENFDTLDQTIVEPDFYTDEYGTVLSAYAPIYRADGTREAIVGVDIFADTIVGRESTALVQERTALTQTVMIAMVTMLLVAVVGLYLGTLLTKPITNLYNEVQKITNGDLSARAKIETSDEVGDLAKAFNTMASELQEILQDLEARVAERTRNLELATEVGRTVSQVRALDVILKEAAELIREQFDLYYVQVYLTDTSQTNLILQSGTGKVGAELVGRGHRLPLNTGSINGRAAVEKNSVVISDTAASLTFRPNQLLPDTRSEMAVPLLVGEKVVGVLDMQSSQAGALSQDMLPAFEALAGQLAIAIQNANLLAETNQARIEVEAQARRLVRANWVDYMDAIHQPEEIGFVFEKNQILPLEKTETSQPVIGVSALSASITVTGEQLGELIVEIEEEKQSTQTVELVNIVARQVAQHIENLRLLESAERYRFDAEQASRRLTREDWKDYTDTNAGASLSYIYDLKEVRPLNLAGEQRVEESGFSLPLKVRDETVGKLAVQGLEPDNTDALELVNAVAERLGAHIEGLRLSQRTEQFARREQALRQITAAVRGSTDPATILRTAARELGTILRRKTVVRLKTGAQDSSPIPLPSPETETARGMDPAGLQPDLPVATLKEEQGEQVDQPQDSAGLLENPAAQSENEPLPPVTGPDHVGDAPQAFPGGAE